MLSKSKTSMTARERVLRTLNFQPTDIVACDLMEGNVWPELMQYFQATHGLKDADEAIEYLDTDFRWGQLATPFTLNAGGWYVVAAEVFASSGDAWDNSSGTLFWNSYFVGSNGNGTRGNRYSPTPWPHEPEGQWGDGSWAYGAVNLAVIPEPSVLGLFAFGFVGFLFRRRTQR